MGVKYLVDTHLVLWLMGDPDRVPKNVLNRLSDPENQLLVSAVSAMEIATKTHLGKLKGEALVAAWSRRVTERGGTELSITTQHALTAGSMHWAHRDPFDRLLVAQAISENATLVTVDRAISVLEVPRILTW